MYNTNEEYYTVVDLDDYIFKLRASKKSLKDFYKTEILPISKVRLWLKEYERTYNYSKLIERAENTFFSNGETIYLPSLSEPTEEEQIIEIYEAFKKLSNFHKNEEYYKKEFLKYETIKNKDTKVKEWLNANEEKYETEDYLFFLIDYLDYDKKNKEYHLKISLLKNTNLNLFVDRKDFINTINFLEIFNTLY